MDRPNRMELQSADGAQLNLDALYQIAPSCFTEVAAPGTGGVKRVINFDVLRQLLGDNAVEDAPEAYEFNWVGKQAARAEVLKPIKKTLRPVKEDSVDWDNTQNLYIEGDNLEVLKLLQKSYLGKVKMIYIDPPYNTGNDFVYHDDFAMSADEYAEASGAVDELGNKYIKNMDSNGRFHSDWCSMMYSRLMVARTLLSEDGVIFISIDDKEVGNLRKICDDIFGEHNFVSNIIWQKKFSRSNDATYFSSMHDHILCYCNNNIKIDEKGWNIGLLPRGEEIPNGYSNPDNDPRGPWTSTIMSAKSGSQSLLYEITTPSGRIVVPPSGRYWSCSRDTFNKWKAENRIWFGINGDSAPRKKTFLSEVQDGLRPNSILFQNEVGNNQEGKQEVKALFNGVGVFDGPKPVRLLYTLLTIGNLSKGDIVLDFFSGSSSTAHAAMKLNAEDGGNRKFIMVQIPEETPEDSEARKAGYKTIPEVAKERIRRAGKKIKEESPLTTADLDTGFRVFRLDEGNYEDVKRSPKEFKQDQLDLFLNNIKADRNDLDLLFGCMLDWGVQLSLPMTQEEVDGKTIYTVNDGDLVACFAENVSEEVVKAMAEKMPLRVIFRDSCFAQDADKINIYETFKQKLDWSDQEVVKNIRVI
ncbi:site-specific DNA-methyltransferase [Segatella copri]|uniref:site-specific DNA-methyltransferase n=1 Tax=Segatella copri TaxID=165179 RepID=UPI001934814B|nr:site-specific DNA-methyltransferase [Segatella copri]MBM0129240.1 site-specific DNA-methyltransferase [Segatella copri]